MLKDRTAATIIDSLTKELVSKGALGVLRHGFKCYGKELRLAYFQPNSGMNPESAARYAANRLTITRQVASHLMCSRSPTACQTQVHHRRGAERERSAGRHRGAEEPAHRPARRGRLQAVQERPGRARSALPLQGARAGPFRRRSRRSLDDDRAEGRRDRLPALQSRAQFRRGQSARRGQWKTHYLWDEVLCADSLLDILQRFMHSKSPSAQWTRRPASARCGERR